MAEHFKTLSAIFPLITDDEGDTRRILLHRRQNTGFQDGMWDIAGSGHVDEGETAKHAVVRECKEELGIDVNQEGLCFAHLSHRISKDKTYYDIYFFVNGYKGVAVIQEPYKCSELKWFDLNDLPVDLIDCRKRAICACLNGNHYSETDER